jgi:hypothetical protein
MGKWKASGGQSAATIEAEVAFDQYDEATYGVPKKGPYRVRLRRLEGSETGENSKEPGTPMLKGMLIISEPKGTKKAVYNGYIMNLNRVANEEQAGRMNQFLTALAGGPGAKAKALIKAFWTTGCVTDSNGMITKIGTMVIKPDGDGILLGVNTRNDNYNDEKRIAPTSFMAESAMPKPAAADEEDDDEEDDGVEVVDDDEDEEVVDDEDEETDELSEEEAELMEELDGLTLAKLKARAKANGSKLAEYKALDKDGLIELIMGQEIEVEDDTDEEDEEDEDEPEEDDEQAERREELEALTAAKLRAVAKSLGLKLAEYKGKDVDELVELILANEFAEDEDEDEDDTEDDTEDDEEDEPEPPKRTRTAARGKPAAATKARAGRKGKEPPF